MMVIAVMAKTSIILALGMLAARLFRRRSAAVLHWIVASAMICSLVTYLAIGRSAVAAIGRCPLPLPSAVASSTATALFSIESFIKTLVSLSKPAWMQ